MRCHPFAGRSGVLEAASPPGAGKETASAGLVSAQGAKLCSFTKDGGPCPVTASI